tara:strand:- start:359130 stop:360770 length:1641 start_codon:yes stop_codon:yes gene_type:complete
MTYLFTHLLNTSLGLFSLDWMNAGLRVMQPVWNPFGVGWVVPLAALLHVCSAIYELVRLPRLQFSRGYWLRLILGFLIPYALIAHYLGSHLTPVLLGYRPEYASSIYSMFNPFIFPVMVFLIVVSWGHGCMGLHYWLRFKSWYSTAWKWAIGPAIALPVLAVAGFVAGGKEVMLQIQDPAIKQALLESHGASTEEELVSEALQLGNVASAGYTAFLAIALAARFITQSVSRRRRTIRIRYSDGTEILVPPGITVLNASALARVRHPSVCGGRGRCSTCRIRVSDGAENLSAPSEEEKRVLSRIRAAPNVRLACSASVLAAVEVQPLLGIQDASEMTLTRSDEFSFGRDTDIAILFADLRGFTQLSENKLPYDIVFMLNQYFQQMGRAIEQQGGHVDKFIGDGIMALFGLHSDLSTGCLSAIRAAGSMEQEMAALNHRMAMDLIEPLQMSIGIHCGHVIVGRMGYGRTIGLTAVGDPVNTASRLEGMTRALHCNLVVSEDVLDQTEIRTEGLSSHEVSVRGRQAPLKVYALQSAAELLQQAPIERRL